MSRIIALCVEDCHPASEDRRYLRCCALTGLQPGLALTPGGVVGWRSDEPAAIRLVVSLDEKLVCYRETGAPGGVRVHRGGRFVEVEELKPVVLLDGDELTLGDRRLRLHVHGFTTTSHEPEYFVASVPAASAPVERSASAPVARAASAPVARSAAVAGLAVAGLLGVAGCDKPPPDKPMEPPPMEVRDHPPAKPPDPMPPMEDPMPPPPPPMEVRDTPPVALPPEEPMPPPPMEPVMEPVMEPPPIEMRPHPPVKPIPRPDDRPRPRPTPPGDPQP